MLTCQNSSLSSVVSLQESNNFFSWNSSTFWYWLVMKMFFIFHRNQFDWFSLSAEIVHQNERNSIHSYVIDWIIFPSMPINPKLPVKFCCQTNSCSFSLSLSSAVSFIVTKGTFAKKNFKTTYRWMRRKEEKKISENETSIKHSLSTVVLIGYPAELWIYAIHEVYIWTFHLSRNHT